MMSIFTTEVVAGIRDVLKMVGDIFFVCAVTAVFVGIVKTKSCAGVSARSLILFTTSYIFRYLPGIWQIFCYMDVIRIMLMILMVITLLLIYFVFYKTYQREKDVFITDILLISAFIMALWSNYNNTPQGIIRAFAVYLESVAILPQFYMILEAKQIEKRLIPYLTAMGLYKIFHAIPWLITYMTYIPEYLDHIEGNATINYTIIFLLGLTTFFIVKVKITDSGSRYFFNNLSLINTNEPLTGRLNVDSGLLIDTKYNFDRPEL